MKSGSMLDLNHLKNVVTEILLKTHDIKSVKYVLEVYEVFELGRKPSQTVAVQGD